MEFEKNNANIKKNYNDWMEREIAKFSEKKTILLHSCCAPCSSSVITRLKDYFNITILYYNPNIEPEEEYLKRKEEQKRFLKLFDPTIQFMEVSYENEKFKEISKNLENEPEGGARCHKCYYLRLEKTVQLAKENHFDYFGTTLTVSPYKNAEIINNIGLKLEEIYNQNTGDKVLFLVSDFKKKEGYKRSIELSQKYNLYRQDYCGCFYAKNDRRNFSEDRDGKRSINK